ncbi:MAG TPA: hypothetical protein VN176_19000 [Verrucomicrobiae bacterium]|jgi:hypothetical protein|nr:hypothetical protein [Verrucomicrobiae bacterium]
MPDSILGKPEPQFSTAEYPGTPGAETCRFCQQPVGAQYYRVNSAVACRNCAEKLQSTMARDTHGAFIGALVFGVGGAIVGLALYAGFTIITKIYFGYVAFAVGWIVAKAMLLGSRGMGGRRYQIAAVLLTYAAVSMAAIPIELVRLGTDHKQTQQASPATTPAGDQQTSASETPEQSAPAATTPKVAVFGIRALVGLASPFLELMDNTFFGVIGLVILFAGIRIAWRMTAGTQFTVYGPFETPPQKA